jgi:ATP-binding cassette subfamily B protein
MHKKKRLFDDDFGRWLLKHLWKYRYINFIALSSLFLLHYTQAKLPTYILDISPLFSNGQINNFEALTRPILEFLLLALGIILFRTSSRWLFFYPARLQQGALRNELIERLAAADPSWNEKITSGELMQILTSDIDSLRAFVGFALLQIFNVFFALVVVIPLLAKLDSHLLLSLIPLFACFLIFSFSIRYSSRMTEKAKVFRDELQQILIEAYDAKKTLNTFSKERPSEKLFSLKSSQELDSFKKANNIRSFARPLLTLGVSLSVVVAAWIIFKYQLKIEYLVITSTYLFLLQEPITLISWITILFSDTKISWKRIKKMLTTIEKKETVYGSLNQQSVVMALNWEVEREKSSIQGNTLENGFNLNEIISKKIVLEFNHYSKILICGSTGSGKTTVIKNLAKLLRNHSVSFALVDQQSILFNDTLINNILLGQELTEKLREKVLQLLDIFQLKELSHHPQELFNLPIGENGKRLSGGQIKRLCLLRCFVSEYEFLLWDDPFASIDVLLEKNIWEKLEEGKFWKKTKLIFTSQRVTALKYATEIIFMDDVLADVNNKSYQAIDWKNKDMIKNSFAKSDLDKVEQVEKFYEKQLMRDLTLPS